MLYVVGDCDGSDLVTKLLEWKIFPQVVKM